MSDQARVTPPMPSGVMLTVLVACRPSGRVVVPVMFLTPVDGVKLLVTDCVTTPRGVLIEWVDVEERAIAGA